MGNKKYKAKALAEAPEDKVTLLDQSPGNTKAPGENLGSGNTPGETNTPRVTKAGGVTVEFLAGYRAHAYELRETGALTSNRLGMEILYLLPDEFVEFYQQLFHRAFNGGAGESVMHGRSGGLDKAPGQTGGMVLGSETRLQDTGSGKRWKNTPMFIGNEQALSLKRSIDLGLNELMAMAKEVERKARVQAQYEKGFVSGNSEGEGDGGEPGSSGLNESKPAHSRATATGGSGRAMQCSGVRVFKALGREGGIEKRKCGRFIKAGWNYCPNCGTDTHL